MLFNNYIDFNKMLQSEIILIKSKVIYFLVFFL